MKPLLLPSSLALIWMLANPAAQAQTSSGQSDYIFRFNEGISSVFLSDMTFASQQSLNLGACTVTEQINGPLSCAVNCQNQSVCLLQLNGPSGSTVADVLEKVSETPSTAASPTPSASASPAPASAYGSMVRSSNGAAANSVKRVEAYNRKS